MFTGMTRPFRFGCHTAIPAIRVTHRIIGAIRTLAAG